MGRVVLDSSVVIASLKSSDIHFGVASQALREGKHINFISAITLAECLHDAAVEALAGELSERIQSRMKVIDVDAEIAQRAAEIRVEHGLKLPDALICATAQIHKMPLWTFDVQQSKVVAGSRLLKTR